MPRTVVPGAVLELAYAGRHDGQRTLNILHFGITTISGATEVDGDSVILGLLAEGYNTETPGEWLHTYLSCISSDFALEFIRSQWVSPTRWSYTTHVPAIAVGLVAQLSMPANVSGVITKRTLLPGRHNIGSLHLPCVPKNEVEGSMLSTDQRTNMSDLAILSVDVNNITVGAATVTVSPLIFNALVPASSQVWLSNVIQPEVRIMRRRTVGVGE